MFLHVSLTLLPFRTWAILSVWNNVSLTTCGMNRIVSATVAPSFLVMLVSIALGNKWSYSLPLLTRIASLLSILYLSLTECNGVCFGIRNFLPSDVNRSECFHIQLYRLFVLNGPD